MNIFKKFNKTFGFTTTESRVILILVAAFLVGLGIKSYKSKFSVGTAFDYSASDSEFTARSEQLNETDSSLTESAARHPARSAVGIISPKATDLPVQKININTATKDELIILPGVGEAMAERIMKYRNEHGSFHSIEELTRIKGIGKKKFEKIAPLCTLER